MLLTLTTTHSPATDIGFLPRKNPARLQSFSLTFGKAHVFYPEATPERCTVALLVEVDPIGLVRNRRGPAGVTHRLSIEIVPGVFGGEILGTFRSMHLFMPSAICRFPECYASSTSVCTR